MTRTICSYFWFLSFHHLRNQRHDEIILSTNIIPKVICKAFRSAPNFVYTITPISGINALDNVTNTV